MHISPELRHLIYLDIEANVLMASWPHSLSVESTEFYETVVALFNIIRDKGITKVMLDSGEPQGGVLSELVVSYGLKVMPFTKIEKVAILESTDFHWDNNLLQLINYLKFTLQFPVEAKILPSKSAALAWFG